MKQPDPQITQVTKRNVAEFIPGAESLNQKQLIERVKELAFIAPDTARQMIDQACRAVDQATEGRYNGELDTLEGLVNRALGLRAGIVPARINGASGTKF
jgi:predicted unusual protein kinase regulating ubiquinone biosynthesis (AarF/ABC1/UbiB family)